MNRQKRKSGLTLIELLVSLGIFAIIAVMGSNLFFSILKGAVKSRIIQEVKQNGDYAISVMERMIRNAVSLDECDPNNLYVVITNPDMDKRQTRFEFCDDLDLIASRSGLLAEGEFLVCDKARLTSNKVKLVSGSFTCSPSENPNKVVIQFTLKQAQEVARPEEETSVDFKTSVVLRNP